MPKISLPIIYSQGDSRWGSLLLGFNTDPKYNFYNFACLITCLAMVAKYYRKDDTPVTINQKLKDLKPAGFVSGGNYVHGSFNRFYEDITEKRTQTPDVLSDAQMGEIRDALDGGFPVMVQIDVNPKTVQADQHFVLLTDYNPSDENDFTIADPITGKLRSLKDYLGWYRPSARKTIEQYVIFSGKKPATQTSSGSISVETGVFESLVKKSGIHDQTSNYLSPNTDPIDTPFEKLRDVIEGIKSRCTSLENEIKKILREFEIAKTEVVNQKDKLANIEKDCQRQLDTQKAYYEALISSAPNIEKIKGSYEGTIKKLESDLREAQKAAGLKDLEIAALKKELDISENDLIQSNRLQKIVDFIYSLISKIK